MHATFSVYVYEFDSVVARRTVLSFLTMTRGYRSQDHPDAHMMRFVVQDKADFTTSLSRKAYALSDGGFPQEETVTPVVRSCSGRKIKPTHVYSRVSEKRARRGNRNRLMAG